jgi:hypothetical protein
MKEDYPIFVKWVEATDWIMSTVEKFPKTVRFTVSSRIVNMTLDVLEGIVEAIYTRNRSHILRRLNLYIEKLRVLFRISFTRRYISKAQYEFVSGLLDETGRMIGGWEKAQ